MPINAVESIASILAQIQAKTPLGQYMPQNILILPQTEIKTFNNEEPNARSSSALRTIALFPKVFREPLSRPPVMANLPAIVAHEWAHQFVSAGFTPVYQRWLQEGKWSELQPGQYVTDAPDKCLNYYAQTLPQEDFCESVRAALFTPNALQTIAPGKFAILKDFLQLNTIPQSIPAYTVSQRTIANDTSPQFPKSHTFTLKQNENSP